MASATRSLREWRLRAGLSQRDLAQLAGITQRAISLIENGQRRRPHPRTRQQLAEALTRRLGTPVGVTDVVEFVRDLPGASADSSPQST